MADSIKIPVELDIAALEQSLGDLKNRMNRDFNEISNTISRSMNNATNNVNRNQQNMANQSSRTGRNIQNAYQNTANNVTNNFNRAASNVNRNQQTIANTSTTVASRVTSSMQRATSSVRTNFSGMASRVGASLQSIGSKATAIGSKLTKTLTLPIVGATTLGVKSAMDYEQALAKVNTIADNTVVPLANMKDEITALSKVMGISVTDLADDVYNAISAGQDTADAVNFVEKSAKLAKAGFAESGQALDLLTTIMNSYGLEAKEVSKVSDILINTQNKGKVTVAELASSMGKVIPTANSVGVNLEQVASGYAIMTAKGIKAAETTTYMNSMLNEMSKSGTTANEAIKKAFNGKSFQALIKEGKSVGDVLAGLDKYAKKNKKSLADMFGSAEAGKAAIILSNNAGKDFNKMLKDMGNVTGATEEAFAKVSDTAKEKFNKTLNKLKISVMELGEKLLPHLTKVLDAVTGLIDRFNGLSEEQQGTILKVGLMVAAIGPLLSIFGKVSTGVGKVTSLFGRFGRVATSAATTTATTVASGATGMASSLGLAGRAVGLLTNPLIAIPAVVAGATAFVIKRTKDLKEELEQNVAVTRDNVLGLSTAYETLGKKASTAATKVSKANKKIFNNDKQLQKDFQKSFEGIELFLAEGVGNIQYLLDKAFEETSLILPNLEMDDKKALASYYADLVYTMTKAEEISVEQAEAYQKLLSEMFDFKVDVKIEQATVELKMKDIHTEIDKILNKNKGLFGFSIDLFGTKKKGITNGIKEQLGEYKDIDKKYVNTKNVVDNLANSLEQSGLSAKKQKDVYLELGETLATSFDNKQAIDIFNRISKEAEFTEEDIAKFMANTTANWDTLDEKTKAKVAKFLGNMESMSSKTKGFLSGDAATLQAMMGENTEVWATIISQNLKGSKDINKTVENLKIDLASALKSLAPEQIPEATAWLGTMLGEIESKGGLTKAKVEEITSYINKELGKLEEVSPEVELKATTNTEAIAELDAEIKRLTGKEIEATALLDSVQFDNIYMDLMRKCNDIGKSNPEVDVKALTKDAYNSLQSIKDQIKYIKENQNLSVNVNKTITTKEKKVKDSSTANKPVSKPAEQGFSLDTPTVISRVGSTLASTFNNIASSTGNISTAKEIISPTITKSTDNVDRKILNKFTRQVSKENNSRPVVVETSVNLDGRTIARAVSNTVDAFNGNTYKANKRRYAY